MNASTTEQKLRIGIVGCGSIARSHVLAYRANPRAELVGVDDIDPDRADAFAAMYGTTPYGTLRELSAPGARSRLGRHPARQPHRGDARAAGGRLLGAAGEAAHQ